MKKTYLIIAAAALTALSACTKNEVRSISDEPSQITWQTVIGPKSTKALVDGNTFDQKYKFKTYAFYNANGTTWPNKASLYIDNAEVSYHKDAVSPFVANSWHADQVYYWPKGGSLTFISYTLADNDANGNAKYPDGVICTPNDGLKVAGYDVNTNKNLDFMVADIKSGQTANTTSEAGAATGVPTVFRHTLTQIVKFNVKTDKDYKGTTLAKGSKVVTVNSIKIVNAFSKGNYQMEPNATTRTESWDKKTLSEKSTYEYAVYENGAIKGQEVTTTGVDLTNEQKAFMPQTFDAPSYTFTGQTEAEKALEKKTQAYIYAVKNVPHIEFKYTVDTYTDASAKSTDVVTEYVALSDINKDGWGINKKITYNITISLAGAQNELIIYWDPTVEKWDDTNSSYDYTI